jgi:endonuclease/exonuclease/phosphatase family metal-dependent hydrolase
LDNQRPQNRVNQARRLGELFGGQFDTPMVLAGDFNARPGSDPIRLLTRDWQDATAAEPEPANPSDNPRSRIDYIFFRPAGRFRVVEARVIDERIASDHRPVLAVLEMP